MIKMMNDFEWWEARGLNSIKHPEWWEARGLTLIKHPEWWEARGLTLIKHPEWWEARGLTWIKQTEWWEARGLTFKKHPESWQPKVPCRSVMFQSLRRCYKSYPLATWHLAARFSVFEPWRTLTKNVGKIYVEGDTSSNFYTKKLEVYLQNIT